jgi:hypothetical protein
MVKGKLLCCYATYDNNLKIKEGHCRKQERAMLGICLHGFTPMAIFCRAFSPDERPIINEEQMGRMGPMWGGGKN